MEYQIQTVLVPKDRFTEQQAISRIGRSPDRAALLSRVLRVLEFGSIGNQLVVTFERDGNIWVIYSWSTY
jgi:hypothetical protein